MRWAGRVILAFGAIGSLALMMYVGRRQQSMLVIALFVVWVSSPFVALFVADVLSARWKHDMQTTIHALMMVVGLGSLIAYSVDLVGPPHPQAAFMYVAVPPATCLFIAIVLPIAALLARDSRRTKPQSPQSPLRE